jgi:ABC-type transporter Mla subunit MlaD
VAQSGNGIDLGAVYRLLTEVAEAVRAHSERFDDVDRRLEQLLRVVNEHSRVFDEHGHQLTELRGAVDQFHEAVISQGIH